MAKRLLVVLLAVAMVVSYAGMAAAKFSDTTGNKQEAAIDRVASLELVKGYPDGTFKPDGSITRAEFATVMCRALGLEDAAQIMAGQPTSFSDVPANHWATGYINVAASQRIIAGYPDGTFKPDAQVTYAEALKMILCALGYNTDVLRNAVWPITWIAKASELGVTGGVSLASGAASLPATRGDVARLVDNSLDIPKVVQKGYGDEVTFEEDPTKTFLADLGFTEVSGRVVNISLTDSNLDDNEVELAGDDAGVYTLPEGVSALSVLGLEVTMWVDDDEVAARCGVDTAASDIVYDSVAEDATDDDVTLVDKDDTFDWADNAEAFVNFGSKDPGDIGKGTWGRFVFDDDGDVIFACVFEFDDSLVVTGIDEDNEEVEGYDDSAAFTVVDLEDYALLTGGFEGISIGDVKEDDLLFFNEDDELALVWRQTVSGDLTDWELEGGALAGITVEGEDYDLAAYATYRDLESEDVDTLDEEAVEAIDEASEPVKVYLDMFGDVRHVDAHTKEALTWTIGMLLGDAKAYETRGVPYFGFDVIDQNGKEVALDDKQADVESYWEGEWGEVDAAVYADFKAGTVVKYAWDGGDLQIYLLNWEDEIGDDIPAADWEVDGDYLGAYEAKDAVLFIVDGDIKDPIDPDDVTVLSWSDAKGKLSKVSDGTAYVEDDSFLKALVATNAAVSLEGEYVVGLVTSVKHRAGDVVEVKMYVDGSLNTYRSDPDEIGSDAFDDVEVGAVVEFEVDEASGEVIGVETDPPDFDAGLELVSGSVTKVDLKNSKVTVGGAVYSVTSKTQIFDATDLDDITTARLRDFADGDDVDLYVREGSSIVAFLVKSGEEDGGAPGDAAKPTFEAIGVWAGNAYVRLDFNEAVKVAAGKTLSTSDFVLKVANAVVPVVEVVPPDGTTSNFFIKAGVAPATGQSVEVTIKSASAAKIVDLAGNALNTTTLTRSATP